MSSPEILIHTAQETELWGFLQTVNCLIYLKHLNLLVSYLFHRHCTVPPTVSRYLALVWVQYIHKFCCSANIELKQNSEWEYSPFIFIYFKVNTLRTNFTFSTRVTCLAYNIDHCLPGFCYVASLLLFQIPMVLVITHQ